MNHVKSINDILKESESIVQEAKQVTTREDHVKVWDKKVELLNMVNDALETGYWTGSLYEKLWEAKHNLLRAERVAGERSIKTYMKA